MQAGHPEGTDVSALHHLLSGHQTIAADRGLFLEETWHLHPTICYFTSELFYEGRLQPLSGLEVQDLIADCRVTGTGLRYLPVPHEGNQNASSEEADCIRDLVAESWQPPQSFRWTPMPKPLALHSLDAPCGHLFATNHWAAGLT
jgi:hypothetical protein